MSAQATIHRWHLSASGDLTELRAIQDGSSTEITTWEPGGAWSTSTSQGDIWDVMGRYPELVTVGAGATRIDWSGLDDQRILAALIVEDPAMEPTAASDWDEETRKQAEDLLGMELADWFGDVTVGGCESASRWVAVNGNPATVVRRGAKAAVIVRCYDPWMSAPYLEPVLTWEFQRLSGGPMQLEGSLTLGRHGRQVWALQTTGDVPRELYYHWPNCSAEEFLVANIQELGWEAPYLRAVIGIPGWGQERAAALHDPSVMGKTVWVSPSLVDIPTVTASLINEDPRVAVMAEALRDPVSKVGRALYGLLQGVSSPKWAVDWDDVDAALWALTGPEEGWPDPIDVSDANSEQVHVAKLGDGMGHASSERVDWVTWRVRARMPDEQLDVRPELAGNVVITAHPSDVFSSELHANCLACTESHPLGLPLSDSREEEFMPLAQAWLDTHVCDPDRPGAMFNPDL